MKYVHRSHVIAATLLIHLVTACGGSSASKKEDKPSDNAAQLTAEAVSLDKQFKFENLTLTKQGDEFLAEKSYVFTTENAANVYLANNGTASNCMGRKSDALYRIEGEKIARATYDLNGFEKIDWFSFPGDLKPGSYILTISFRHTESCEVYSGSYTLESRAIVPAASPTPAPTAVPSQSTAPLPTPSPTPSPIPSPIPSPVPTAFDTALVGTWVESGPGYSFRVVIGSNATARQTLTFGTQVLLDIDTALSTQNTSPKRMDQRVTAIRVNSNDDPITVGEINKCIYRLNTSTNLSLECSEDNSYPTTISAEANTLVRQ